MEFWKEGSSQTKIASNNPFTQLKFHIQLKISQIKPYRFNWRRQNLKRTTKPNILLECIVHKFVKEKLIKPSEKCVPLIVYIIKIGNLYQEPKTIERAVSFCLER